MQNLINMTINENQKSSLQALDYLLTILMELRTKCPWDKEQTMDSLRCLTIEETFELSEAILAEDVAGIKEELGDLLLHVLFYAQIANERNEFTLADCIKDLCDKLIRRHPHIFQQATSVATKEDVNKNWQQIKLAEKNRNSILEGIPTSLPSINKAMSINDKANSAGFTWKASEDLWQKVQEELQELGNEINSRTDNDSRECAIEDEFGDVLFTLVNYAQFIHVDPDRALEKANQKFMRRFQQLERQLKDDNKQLAQLTRKEMVDYWNKAKAYINSLSGK